MTLFASLILALTYSADAWYPTPDLDRATLESRYLADPGDLREVAGTIVHVRDSAGADDSDNLPVVVLLHGLGSHLQTFDPWADALRSHYRVIRLDWPGSGLSPADSTGVFTDLRSMAILKALLAQLNVEQAFLVGNSIGGRIAWRFAAKYSSSVRGVVLISPDGFASPGFQYNESPNIPTALQTIRYALPKSLLNASLAMAYGDVSRLSAETLDRYHDLLRAPGNREALLLRMSQTILPEPGPLLKTIEAPVLLLWGERDRMIPVANAQDYLDVLPNARLVQLPNAGHVPQEEIPLISLEPVKQFLDCHARLKDSLAKDAGMQEQQECQ
ncbi:MAG: alpha/beta fold hydrolase [Lysobacterales bacterium]